jgi:hypothetical protein
MRKNNLMAILTVLILTAVMAIGLSTALEARPTMAVDSNGYPLQMGRTFVAVDSLLAGAGTAWITKAVPTNAVYATLIAAVGAITFGSTSAWTTAYTTQTGVLLPVGVPVKIPVMNMSNIYYRRAATGTAATLYIIWEKM